MKTSGAGCAPGGGRQPRVTMGPDVVMQGRLRVSDPQAFAQLLARGEHLHARQLYEKALQTFPMQPGLCDGLAAVLRRAVPQPEGIMVQLSVDVADMDKATYFKGRL